MFRKVNWIVEFRAFFYALNLSGFGIIVVLAMGLLLNVGQGQDMLRSLHEDGWPQRVYLSLSTLFMAFNLWLWARMLLHVNYPYPPGPLVKQRLLFYRTVLPRVLAILGILCVVQAYYQATETVLRELLFIIFLLIVWPKFRPHFVSLRVKSMADDKDDIWDLLTYIKKDNYSKIACTIAVLGVVEVTWGLLDPFSLARFFNNNIILLLFSWSAGFLAVGSLVNYLTNRRGIPVVFIALLCAGIFSYWNDNHDMRLLVQEVKPKQHDIAALADSCHANSGERRPSLVAAIKDWQRHNCHEGKCKPFIVMTGAGGGIRAAYWTGTVLAKLHDAEPSFNEHLFALSTVSGGSLGAAVYRAALQDVKAQEPLEPLIQQVLGQDYLTPLSAGLLYRDFVQLFLPLPWLPDRAVTFEKSLEYNYRQVMQCRDQASCDLEPQYASGLSSAISTYSEYNKKSWPALFLNATWSENGQRIVSSTVKVDKQSWQQDWQCAMGSKHRDVMQIQNLQPLYNDLLSRIDCAAHVGSYNTDAHCDIALSTAVHNSARFPLVSPPGYWCYNGELQSKQLVEGTPHCEKQRLLDGGIYENFGARTALDILRVAEHIIGKAFNPHLIIVTSDPTLPKDFTRLLPTASSPSRAELVINLNTLLNARNAHGIEHMIELQQFVSEHSRADDAVFHFRMCPSSSLEPPLGWSLSNQAKHTIACYLSSATFNCSEVHTRLRQSCVSENQQTFDRLVDLM